MYVLPLNRQCQNSRRNQKGDAVEHPLIALGFILKLKGSLAAITSYRPAASKSSGEIKINARKKMTDIRFSRALAAMTYSLRAGYFETCAAWSHGWLTKKQERGHTGATKKPSHRRGLRHIIEVEGTSRVYFEILGWDSGCGCGSDAANKL